MPKRRFQMFLEDAQFAAMQQIERTTGAPVAAQIRLAIDAWLAKQGVRATTTKRPPRKGR
jgi:hypothetical protein